MNRVLFFDLDNTLFDRDALVIDCCRDVLTHLHPAQPRAYEAVLQALSPQIRSIRNCRELTRWLQQRYPGDITLQRVDGIYTRLLARLTPVASIVALVHDLSAEYRLAVITNGSRAKQRLKIERLGLAPYLDAIFISGELGMAKPDQRLFLHAQSRMGCLSSACVMIGDDPMTDIAGAARAGWTTCWLATQQAYPDSRPEPDITIRYIDDCRRIFLA